LLVQAAVAGADNDVFERKELENLEMRRTLREVSWLKVLTDYEIALLSDSCHFVTFQDGDVIMAQGKSSNKLYIIHSGEVKIFLDASGTVIETPPKAQGKTVPQNYGTEISVATEGQILGEISFLTGQPHTATVVAARNCSMVMITPQALQPILKCNSHLISELTELMQQHLSSKPKSPGVTLRIHQSLACGQLWLAHLGGEHVIKPHDYGARREFVVIGNALLRAAEALDEAPVGTIVVSKVAWQHVADKYVGEETKLLNFMIKGVNPRHEGPLLASPIPRHEWDEDIFHVWTQLKLYCHEGARDLQDVAPFAAEVRKMTVLFVRLHLDLENPDYDTVEDSHRALLAIQKAIYSRNGTLRQFLQDDKGLLAICIMGMPPFSPHENDPTRGVLAAMDIRQVRALEPLEARGDGGELEAGEYRQHGGCCPTDARSDVVPRFESLGFSDASAGRDRQAGSERRWERAGSGESRAVPPAAEPRGPSEASVGGARDSGGEGAWGGRRHPQTDSYKQLF
jgi:CRP-like cAMP-binding protein